jgi:hypothetical protein
MFAFQFWSQYSPADAVIVGRILAAIHTLETSCSFHDLSVRRKRCGKASCLKRQAIPVQALVMLPLIANVFVPASHDRTDECDQCSGIVTSESAPSCLGDNLDTSPVFNAHFMESFDSDSTKTKPNTFDTGPASPHIDDMWVHALAN